MTSQFVHLRNRTTFSIKSGLQSPKGLIEAAKTAGMPAVAISDVSNMFAAIKLFKYSKGSGVKPLIGAEIVIKPDERYPLESTLVLIAKNNDGYRELMEVVSEGYLAHDYEKESSAYVQREHLMTVAGSGNLIALSGGIEGDIGQAIISSKFEVAHELAAAWKSAFGDNFFIEISRTGKKLDDLYLQPAIDVALELDIPVVATNNNVFPARTDFESHEIRVCIAEKQTLASRGHKTSYSPHQYFKSTEEMVELFSDIPEAIENTVKIAEMCNVAIELGKNYLPRFPTEEGQSEADLLKQMAREGLEELFPRILKFYDPGLHSDKIVEYKTRLERELGVIESMGFAGYFLIVADFIRWSKRNDVPVGAGRGSGAGSLVAFACKITDIDPLPYDLLFERFLNPERVSMPDFDIDFCMDKRDLVIKYVAGFYGHDSVSQIATFGTMAAKGSVKDINRVMGLPFSLGEKISNLIPSRPGITLKEALIESPQLQDLMAEDLSVAMVIEKAKILEGTHRSVGKHAGGVLISPTKITDFSPVYRDSNVAGITSQYYKDDVEAAGLVKFDFLGLRTLTVIDWAVKSVNRVLAAEGRPLLDITDIDMHDDLTYQRVFNKHHTTAVFQLESTGMKALVKKLKPDCFEDLIALVALFRPGPLQSGMVDIFINRKHGIEPIEYLHPSLGQILAPTYGVIVYQEQVMQIAQVMAGYSLGGADLLRRAMGKKMPEEMAKQRTTFTEGCLNNGIDKKTAEDVFDLMEYFSGYGFNKSHSAAYALISYQTAFLKAHYPAHFMAASMSSEMDNLDKIALFCADVKSIGVEVLPLNINESIKMFTAKNETQILFGFGAVKGVGDAALDVILAEREENGPFLNFFDFIKRTNSKVNKTSLSALVKSGSLDCFGMERAEMMALIEPSLEYRKKVQKIISDAKNGMSLDAIIANLTKAKGKGKAKAKSKKVVNEDQFSLFGDAVEQVDGEPEQENTDRADSIAAIIDSIPLPSPGGYIRPWNLRTRLGFEAETMGVYMTGHPLDDYRNEINNTATCQISSLNLDEHGYNNETKKTVLLVGAVTSLVVKTKGSKKNAFFNLDDGTGAIKVSLFGNHYNAHASKIENGNVLVVSGKIQEDRKRGGGEADEEEEISIKLAPTDIQGIAELRERFAKNFIIEIPKETISNDQVNKVLNIAKRYGGGYCKTYIIAKGDGEDSHNVQYGALSIIPSDNLIDDLKLAGFRSFVLHENTKIPYKVASSGEFTYTMATPAKANTTTETIDMTSAAHVRDIAREVLQKSKEILREYNEFRGDATPILSRKLKTRESE